MSGQAPLDEAHESSRDLPRKLGPRIGIEVFLVERRRVEEEDLGFERGKRDRLE
jgi:hypothetical protein